MRHKNSEGYSKKKSYLGGVISYISAGVIGIASFASGANAQGGINLGNIYMQQEPQIQEQKIDSLYIPSTTKQDSLEERIYGPKVNYTYILGLSYGEDSRQADSLLVDWYDKETHKLPKSLERAVQRYLGNTEYMENLKRAISKSTQYLSYIEDASRLTGGVISPEVIQSLMIIESSANPNAVSSKLAVGFVQFLKETAKKYGIPVGFGVDYRRHPEESLNGAAKYLAYISSKVFGDINLAVAGYNCGEGAVEDIINSNLRHSKNPFDATNLERVSKKLPTETQKHVVLFNVVKRTIETLVPGVDYEVLADHSLENRPVYTAKGDTLDTLSRKYRISKVELKKDNPHIRDWSRLRVGTQIFVPLVVY